MDSEDIIKTIKDKSNEFVKRFMGITESIEGTEEIIAQKDAYLNEVSKKLKTSLIAYINSFYFTYSKIIKMSEDNLETNDGPNFMDMIHDNFQVIIVLVVMIYSISVVFTSSKNKRNILFRGSLTCFFSYFLVFSHIDLTRIFNILNIQLKVVAGVDLKSMFPESLILYFDKYNIRTFLTVVVFSLIFVFLFRILKHIPVIYILFIRGVSVFDNSSEYFGIYVISFVLISFIIYIFIFKTYYDVLTQVFYSFLGSFSMLCHYGLYDYRSEFYTKNDEFLENFDVLYYRCFNIIKSKYFYIFFIIFVFTMFNQKYEKKEERVLEVAKEKSRKHKER